MQGKVGVCIHQSRDGLHPFWRTTADFSKYFRIGIFFYVHITPSLLKEQGILYIENELVDNFLPVLFSAGCRGVGAGVVDREVVDVVLDHLCVVVVAVAVVVVVVRISKK
jgi:hypothetical protein